MSGSHSYVTEESVEAPPPQTVLQPPVPPLSVVEEDEDVLWGADPNCEHDIRDAPGGGIKCSKCPGWFCF